MLQLRGIWPYFYAHRIVKVRENKVRGVAVADMQAPCASHGRRHVDTHAGGGGGFGSRVMLKNGSQKIQSAVRGGGGQEEA
jgi:hypothetical protein